MENEKVRNRRPYLLISLGAILLILITGLLYFVFFKDSFLSEDNEPEVKETEYEVILKDEINDNSTDIYLKNLDTNEEDFYLSISDMYSSHYHPYEYHNNNLYVIRRIGDIDTENWIDELWRYDADLEREKIYSSKGLDFRVSEDESIIAIRGPENTLTILDNQGVTQKEFTIEELAGPENVDAYSDSSFAEVRSDFIWIYNTNGMNLESINKIETDDFEFKTFDVAELDIRSEYTLNTQKEALAFSNHPIFFDAESAQEFVDSKEDVTLYLYDLNTKNLTDIATTKGLTFEPEWIDSDTLEYNKPGSMERVTYSY
jgi:hypothetical protein